MVLTFLGLQVIFFPLSVLGKLSFALSPTLSLILSFVPYSLPLLPIILCRSRMSKLSPPYYCQYCLSERGEAIKKT